MAKVLQGCVGCGSPDYEPSKQDGSASTSTTPTDCQEALEHAGCLNTVNVINCRK